MVINTATYEKSGYITLGGYYEGALKRVTVNNVPESKPNKIPLLMQLYPWGEFRSNFGAGGYVYLPSPTTDLNSCTIDKTYISNASPNPASIQYIVAGHNEVGDGYMMKEVETLCNGCHNKVHQTNKIVCYDNRINKRPLNFTACRRCYWMGYFNEYAHINAGKCFRCDGNQFDELIAKNKNPNYLN